MKKLVPVLVLSLFAGSAFADARIDFRNVEGSGASMQSILIGHGKMRTDADADASTSVILDPTNRSMTLLQHNERKYTRIDREQLSQMGGMLDSAMAQMEQALADLPPEMRAQMQGMIGGAIGGAAGQPMVRVVETGRSDTVAGHGCRIYETRMQNQVVSETCMGAPSALSALSASDRRVLDGALAMSQELAESLNDGPFGQLVDLGPFQSGLFPLRVTEIENGRRSTSEFAGIDSSALSADLFAIPAGYREEKIEMPSMPGRR